MSGVRSATKTDKEPANPIPKILDDLDSQLQADKEAIGTIERQIDQQREAIRQLRQGGYLDASLLDHEGPEVDEELVRALVRRELPEPELRRVLRLIHTVGPWHDAYERLLIESARQLRRK